MNKISLLCLLFSCATPFEPGEPTATALDIEINEPISSDPNIAICVFAVCAPTAPIDRASFDLELDLRVTLDISLSSNASRCEDILVTRSTTSGAKIGDLVTTPLNDESTLCEVRRDPTDDIILWSLDDVDDSFCEADLRFNPLDWNYPNNTTIHFEYVVSLE